MSTAEKPVDLKIWNGLENQDENIDLLSNLFEELRFVSADVARGEDFFSFVSRTLYFGVLTDRNVEVPPTALPPPVAALRRDTKPILPPPPAATDTWTSPTTSGWNTSLWRDADAAKAKTEEISLSKRESKDELTRNHPSPGSTARKAGGLMNLDRGLESADSWAKWSFSTSEDTFVDDTVLKESAGSDDEEEDSDDDLGPEQPEAIKNIPKDPSQSATSKSTAGYTSGLRIPWFSQTQGQNIDTVASNASNINKGSGIRVSNVSHGGPEPMTYSGSWGEPLVPSAFNDLANWSTTNTTNTTTTIRDSDYPSRPFGFVYLLPVLAGQGLPSSGIGELSIGVILDYDYRLKGLAREAVHHTLKYAFETLKTHRVEAKILNNYSRERALVLYTQKGFVHEGTRRRCFFSPVEHEWKDLTCLAMLDTDWTMQHIHKRRAAPMSLWDELFLRHEKEREQLLMWDDGVSLPYGPRRLKKHGSDDTIRGMFLESSSSDSAMSDVDGLGRGKAKRKSSDSGNDAGGIRQKSSPGFSSDEESDFGDFRSLSMKSVSRNPFDSDEDDELDNAIYESLKEAAISASLSSTGAGSSRTRTSGYSASPVPSSPALSASSRSSSNSWDALSDAEIDAI